MADKSSGIQTKEKPKICAIDLDQEIIEALQAKGLHCFGGTLGVQVKVPNSGSHNRHPCLLNYEFPPNLHEYDIVIVDLRTKEPIEYDEPEHTHSFFKGSEQTVLLSSYPETIFDPRPLSAKFLGKELESFFRKETLIIVFSDSKEVVEYHPALITRHGHHEQNSLEHSLYDFLPCVQSVRNKTGLNIVVAPDIRLDIASFLHKYSKKFIYQAVFTHPEERLPKEYKTVKRDNFISLLQNSDNEIVGFADFLFDPTVVFVFPQIIENKKEFLVELFDDILPGIFPKIFPYSEQFSWLRLERFFLPNQSSFLMRRKKLEEEYERALAKMEEEIQQNQIKFQFLHNLITETNDSLVKSVEYFFTWLGFKKIINRDESNLEIKEEDLQIPLDDGLLIVEIKGIGGTSKDNDCSQISKVKYRRLRERNKFDVYALYLVNHQRYIPPTERKNPPFSKQQIADAQLDERGLLTTYELFKLYSNIENGFTTKEDARFSLLKHGLVQFKPSKSRLLGHPLEVHHKGQVVILNVANLTVNKGASIIVCNDEAWFRAEILEIRLNDEIVASVSEGEIGLRLSRSVLKTSELWLEDTIVDVS